MNIYIATKLKSVGQEWAEKIQSIGHTVRSTWMWEDDYGKPKSDSAKRDAAGKCCDEIFLSDALVLIAEPEGESCKGGKFFEAGFALALGIPVIVVGHLENTMLFHRCIHQASYPYEVKNLLDSFEEEAKAFEERTETWSP